MKPSSFFGKLHKLDTLHASGLGMLISPRLAEMPLPLQKHDDPFLPFGKAIIDATHDLVSAYVFDFAAYLALGAAGAIALERTAAYVGGSALRVLHGPFVGGAYGEAARAFNADALTVASGQDADTYQATDLGVFMIRGHRLKLLGADFDLCLLGDAVLYAGQREDFAERVRAAVQAAGSS